MPPGSGEQEPHLHPRSDHTGCETLQDFLEPESILSSLREQVAAGDKALEILLQDITNAAQFIMAADGAALAMRCGSDVVCVARNGEISPELGARVSEDTGISGKCLLTGRLLECKDTEVDPTVNVEACRAFGIRSIAAAPIRLGDSTVGVLEVFSKSARAFTGPQLEYLTRVAALVETAASIADQKVTPLLKIRRLVEEFSAGELMKWASATVFNLALSWWLSRKWRYGVLAGMLVIAMLLIANWWASQARFQKTAKIGTMQSAPKPNQTLAKTEPGFVIDITPRTQTKPLVHASKKEIDEPVVVRRFSNAPVTKSSERASRTNFDDEPLSEPPLIPSQKGTQEALGSIVADRVVIPELSVPVSRGVTPPVLERRVNPVYPAQARTLRLAGKVVLDAWVNEKGLVEEVNLVNGDPVLGKAAIEAVKEWRFRAARLNGRPTKMQTQVTINFQDSSAR